MPRSVVTQEQIEEMAAWWNPSISYIEGARKFGVSQDVFRRAMKKAGKWEPKCSDRYSNEERETIRRMLSEKKTVAFIAKEIGRPLHGLTGYVRQHFPRSGRGRGRPEASAPSMSLHMVQSMGGSKDWLSRPLMGVRT